MRRRDNLTAAVHMLVEVLFWFYPLVWWIGARLLEEREWACDEAVIAGGVEPNAYAETILEVCRQRIESPEAVTRRIARVLEGEEPQFGCPNACLDNTIPVTAPPLNQLLRSSRDGTIANGFS